jgi:hypothetical protein
MGRCREPSGTGPQEVRLGSPDLPAKTVMVAFFWILGDEGIEPRIRLLFAAFGIVAVILVGAGIIELVKRWRKKPFQAKMSASEQLAQFRESFEKGQISPEEFARIRALLNERIRLELEVTAAAPVKGLEEKSPPAETAPGTNNGDTKRET